MFLLILLTLISSYLPKKNMPNKLPERVGIKNFDETIKTKKAFGR